jgi:hypothetical protein
MRKLMIHKKVTEVYLSEDLLECEIPLCLSDMNCRLVEVLFDPGFILDLPNELLPVHNAIIFSIESLEHLLHVPPAVIADETFGLIV